MAIVNFMAIFVLKNKGKDSFLNSKREKLVNIETVLYWPSKAPAAGEFNGLMTDRRECFIVGVTNIFVILT